MTSITAYVGLGSNVGDRAASLERALVRLGATPGIECVRSSTPIETDLVGEGPPQGRFLNAVAELRTTLSPEALLGVLLAIERLGGRRPAPPNHPRSLDLDLLAYGDEVIDRRDLVVPHPRWHERAFVIEPLAELGVDTSGWHRWERPELLETPEAFASLCTRWLRGGCRLGLVPTMGALHEGHLSLVERARRACDRVAVTVFVNPLQFGAGEDLDRYPRTLARDLELCRQAGADAVFAPSERAMYGPGFCSRIETGDEARGMEGEARPEHFTGVVTVVARLLAMARPSVAYFGEKDAQQLAVIRRMVADLGFPVEIVGCPIVREPDGLAMSSRNAYLDASSRERATVLFAALSAARDAFASGERDRDALLGAALEVLGRVPAIEVDYVELRGEGDLRPLPPGPIDGGRILVAARLDAGGREVRLIDNLSLEGE